MRALGCGPLTASACRGGGFHGCREPSLLGNEHGNERPNTIDTMRTFTPARSAVAWRSHSSGWVTEGANSAICGTSRYGNAECPTDQGSVAEQGGVMPEAFAHCGVRIRFNVSTPGLAGDSTTDGCIGSIRCLLGRQQGHSGDSIASSGHTSHTIQSHCTSGFHSAGPGAAIWLVNESACWRGREEARFPARPSGGRLHKCPRRPRCCAVCSHFPNPIARQLCADASD